jgi:3-oxoacyl-[acyl-carrier protein] reductase
MQGGFQRIVAAGKRYDDSSAGRFNDNAAAPPPDAMTASDIAARLGPPAGARLAVTGGCGGIGRALVAAALADGLEVAVLDLPASIERHPPPRKALVVALDATDEQSVAGAFGKVARRWPALDGLVNLAGFARERIPLSDTRAADWEEVIAGNLRSTWLASRAAVPLLAKGNAPAIVNAASGLAVRSTAGFGPYSAAKAGVLGLSRSLAIELAPRVRVNAIAPTAVDTAFLHGGTGRSDERAPSLVDLETYAKSVPLGRVATPDDVVGPILFLLGPAARYITGQTLHINGGLLMP